MSILCLAIYISWYSTRNFSTASFSVSVGSVSVQSNRFKASIRDSTSSFGFSFSFSCSSRSSFKVRVCIGVLISALPGFSGVGNHKMLFCCSGLFVLSNWLKEAVRSGSTSGMKLRIAVSTGLMDLDCSGVTTENSAYCVFFLIKYGNLVVLVILTAVFLSIIVKIEWNISRLAASVNFPTGITVPVVCHSDGWSTNAVIVFVVIGGTTVLSWIKTGWGLAPASIAAFLACIVRCGKWMRPCVLSMTTLLCLMKSNPIMGPVNFFITTKCSAKVLSPMSNLSVAVDMGFSNRPFATWI